MSKKPSNLSVRTSTNEVQDFDLGQDHPDIEEIMLDGEKIMGTHQMAKEIINNQKTNKRERIVRRRIEFGFLLIIVGVVSWLKDSQRHMQTELHTVHESIMGQMRTELHTIHQSITALQPKPKWQVGDHVTLSIMADQTDYWTSRTTVIKTDKAPRIPARVLSVGEETMVVSVIPVDGKMHIRTRYLNPGTSDILPDFTQTDRTNALN